MGENIIRLVLLYLYFDLRKQLVIGSDDDNCPSIWGWD